MKFVQTISFTTAREDEMRALSQEWSENGGESPGLLSTKVLRDRDRENTYVVVAEFENFELAMENSARPETDAMAKRMAELVDAPPVFTNYDVIDEQ
jgi:quinol monooxygenase YgiN